MWLIYERTLPKSSVNSGTVTNIMASKLRLLHEKAVAPFLEREIAILKF